MDVLREEEIFNENYETELGSKLDLVARINELDLLESILLKVWNGPCDNSTFAKWIHNVSLRISSKMEITSMRFTGGVVRRALKELMPQLLECALRECGVSDEIVERLLAANTPDKINELCRHYHFSIRICI